MRKILYILPNLYSNSGVSSVVMNYFNNINRRKVSIDFLVMKKYADSYENEIRKSGSNIFYMKNEFSFKNIKKIKSEIRNFFKENKFDIVELHAPIFSFLFLSEMKKCGIPIRIIHSHSTIHSTNKLKNIISIFLNLNTFKYANYYFTCSEKSGKYWYGDKICNSDSYKLITNGIDIKKYKFDKKSRNELRKKYNIEDKIVIGFVGRISKDKNLNFFIEVMKKLLNIDKRYVFLVVGDGRELEKIRLMSKNMQNNIIFLGRCTDVNKQLNCMDLLVLPSKREGLPMVAVEAQLTDIPCLLSDTITNEVNIGGATFLKLNRDVWVKEILNFDVKNKNKTIDRNKFDIKECAKNLEEIYLTIDSN